MLASKGTIIRAMNTLEVLYELQYYDKSEEAEKEHMKDIEMYQQFLGFDDEFMKLKIKW